MKILALDIATNTGIAVGTAGRDPQCWSVNLGEPPHSRRLSSAERAALENRRYANAITLTEGLLERHKPDLTICEAPIGGKNASAYLIGLVACARGAAHRAGFKMAEVVYPGTVRKHFVERAYTSRDFPKLKKADAKIEIKRIVKRRCHMLGWNVPDLDAADAAATWDWACVEYVPGYQAKPQGALFNG